MQRTISFKEFREVKDALPKGATKQLAERLGMEVQTVNNYFGGHDFDSGKSTGVHFEQGGGGVVNKEKGSILKSVALFCVI